jgi:hypothetical protein
MTLATNVTNLATRVATECKSIRTLVNGNAADLSALTTTAKSNLVAAVNELKAAVDAASAGSAGIDDATTATTTTWSSSKVSSELTSTLNSVLDGAPAALDTLNELAAAIGDDASYAATVTTALGRRVSVDAQTFTSGEQTQARTNIDAASATNVGDTATDFTATFVAGLA